MAQGCVPQFWRVAERSLRYLGVDCHPGRSHRGNVTTAHERTKNAQGRKYRLRRRGFLRRCVCVCRRLREMGMWLSVSHGARFTGLANGMLRSTYTLTLQAFGVIRSRSSHVKFELSGGFPAAKVVCGPMVA